MHSRLRERLGDAKIAYYVFHHGLLAILDLDLTQDLGVLRPSARMLMGHLEDLMKWHGGMLRSLVDHQTDPDVQTAQLWSSPTHAPWREQQRQHKAEAKQIYELGETLATASEDRKRRPWNMTDREICETIPGLVNTLKSKAQLLQGITVGRAADMRDVIASFAERRP